MNYEPSRDWLRMMRGSALSITARLASSLSTWANDATKDITVSQTLLRHSKPDMTAVYTHGNFEKALDAQRQYLSQLFAAKPVSGVVQ